MTPRTRLRTAALAVVLAVGAAACGSDGDQGAAATSSPTEASTTAAPASGAPTTAGSDATPTTAPAGGDQTQAPATTAAEVPDLLRYAGPTVSGDDLDLAAYAGQPVAFWFWAPG